MSTSTATTSSSDAYDSDEDWDMHMQLVDNEDDTGADASDEREEDTDSENEPDSMMPPMITLRQRRLSKSVALESLNTLRANVAAGESMKIKLSASSSRARYNWSLAMRKAKLLSDPWKAFHIEDIDAEPCTRHRYNPHKKTWSTDEVHVKMEAKVLIFLIF